MDQHPVAADVCFQSVHIVWAANATLYEVGTIPLGVKQLERQDHRPPNSAKIVNEKSYAHIPPHFLMACCLI